MESLAETKLKIVKEWNHLEKEMNGRALRELTNGRDTEE